MKIKNHPFTCALRPPDSSKIQQENRTPHHEKHEKSSNTNQFSFYNVRPRATVLAGIFSCTRIRYILRDTRVRGGEK